MNRKKKLTISVIFFVAVAFLAGGIYTSYCREIAGYNETIESLDKQIEAQKKYGEELDVAGSESMSEENVIRIARETLGLVKAGEKFFKNYNDNQ